jgi:hypothetical protein
MGIWPNQRRHLKLCIAVPLLSISVLSCSKSDLPKFISENFKNQNISETPKEGTQNAQQELEKKIEITDQNMNAMNTKLAHANSELNEKNSEIIFLKQKISENKLQISELNKKLNDSRQKNILKKPEKQNIQQQFQKREAFLKQKENEIHAKFERFTNQTNRFKSYQEEVNNDFLKRKQGLDQREGRVDERERVVERNFRNRNTIKNKTDSQEMARKLKANKTVQEIPQRKTLFTILPVNNYKHYNKQIVLDRDNNLFWSRLNFYQKEGSYPESRSECSEWAAQMKREKYGGIDRWRVPTHRELSQLHYLYQYVLGGDSENFKYWGVESKGTPNLTLFEFRNASFQDNTSSQAIANCRVIANQN